MYYTADNNIKYYQTEFICLITINMAKKECERYQKYNKPHLIALFINFLLQCNNFF